MTDDQPAERLCALPGCGQPKDTVCLYYGPSGCRIPLHDPRVEPQHTHHLFVPASAAPPLRHDDTDEPERATATASAFRQVVDELTGGCGCVCHTGTGYNTSCVHCQPAPVEALSVEQAWTWGTERLPNGRTNAEERAWLYEALAVQTAATENARTKMAVQAATIARLRGAANKALAHVVELREAWRTGALDERDTLGGTRSNRNVDVEMALREAVMPDPTGGHTSQE